MPLVESRMAKRARPEKGHACAGTIQNPKAKSQNRLRLAATLVAALLAGGCVTIHPRGPCGPACPIITDASYIIEYPNERLKILKRVAARPELSTHEQIYLVNAVMAVGFSSDKAIALITLIENPCCTAETRQHIHKMLKVSRMLGRDERRVIEALEKADLQAGESLPQNPDAKKAE